MSVTARNCKYFEYVQRDEERCGERRRQRGCWRPCRAAPASSPRDHPPPQASAASCQTRHLDSLTGLHLTAPNKTQSTELALYGYPIHVSFIRMLSSRNVIVSRQKMFMLPSCSHLSWPSTALIASDSSAFCSTTRTHSL